MAKVKIQKFIDGVYETSFSVPTFVLGMAKTLLPMTALNALAGQGFDVREILDAHARGVAYSSTFAVHEHGIRKQISVSLSQTLEPTLRHALLRRLP